MRAENIVIEPFDGMIVTTCNITKMVNHHIKVEIVGIISKEEAEKIQRFHARTQIAVHVSDEDGVTISIFSGLIERLSIMNENGMKRISLLGISNTSMLDEKEKMR